MIYSMSDKAPKKAYDNLLSDEEITDFDVLRRQVTYLRMVVRDCTQHVDCVTSPLWKRIWWWFGGFYFRKVGRWYSYDTLSYKVWFYFAQKIKLT